MEKRILKAYERYDYNGRVVPGSLVLRSKKPKNGKWKEVQAYRCCNETGGICTNFWINQTVNPDNLDGVWTVGSGMDTQCNSFMIMEDYWTSPNNPNQDSPQNLVLQKLNNAGEVVWNRVFDFAESGVDYEYLEAQTMGVDKNNNVIVCLIAYVTATSKQRTGIIKFDNDGNKLWAIILTDSIYDQEYVTSIKFDSFNNIYLAIRGGGSTGGIIKVTPEGAIVDKKYLVHLYNLDECYIEVNSNNEIYLITKYYGPPPIYNARIIKLDSSLNEIWNKSFDPDTGGTPYGIALDANENIVFQIGNGIGANTSSLFGAYIKVSPEGNFIWATRISNTIDPDVSLGTFQLDSDKSGNVYISSGYPSSIPGYSTNPSNTVIIAKLLPNGSLDWVYGIESVSSIYPWYWSSPIVGKVVNNALILAYYNDGDPFDAQLFKLPLTAVADGTYGDYTFTNITNLWTTSNPSIILSDAESIWTSDSTNSVELNYLTFEGTYTTTLTSL